MSKSIIKRLGKQIKHADWCNTEHPCHCKDIMPPHNYVGPIDCADCLLCGHSLDMPWHIGTEN